jgi:hypothetical protein
MNPLTRIPVVGGLAYAERHRQRPSTFEVSLQVEPDNRYLPDAVAVLSNGEKLGYLAPEIAREFGDRLAAAREPARTWTARKGAPSDHGTSGVELLLDFTNLGLAK